MKQGIYIILILISSFCFAQNGFAQQKVIQLYGIVKASDSTTLPGASIYIKGTHRGTIANDFGIYSIAVTPGDQIEFSFIGFKNVTIKVPVTSPDQLMQSPILETDTAYLPTAIVSPLPTPAQFKLIFLNAPDIPTNDEIARENINIKRLLLEMRNLPMDAQGINTMHAQEKVLQTSQRGLNPSSGILNPFAWVDFIRSLKEGGQQ